MTHEYEETDPEKVFASMVAGGVLGIVAGAAVASRGEISPGTATLVNFGSLWGSWYGLALSFVLNQDRHEDRVLLWTLVGGNAGLIGTALLAPRHDVSRTRARFINIAGVLGLLGGAGLDLLLQPEDEAVVFGIPLVTSAAGLIVGASLTRHDAGARAEAGREPEMNALIQVRDGKFALGLPDPLPVLRRGRGGARGGSPGVAFTLLQARF